MDDNSHEALNLDEIILHIFHFLGAIWIFKRAQSKFSILYIYAKRCLYDIKLIPLNNHSEI